MAQAFLRQPFVLHGRRWSFSFPEQRGGDGGDSGFRAHHQAYRAEMGRRFTSGSARAGSRGGGGFVPRGLGEHGGAACGTVRVLYRNCRISGWPLAVSQRPLVGPCTSCDRPLAIERVERTLLSAAFDL